MLRLIKLLIEILCWLSIFLSPVLFFSITAWLIYISTPCTPLSVIIALAGIAAGIAFAERIRRKYGCSSFMGRLLSAPEFRSKAKKN